MIVYFDSSALVKIILTEEGADLATELWEHASWRVTSHVTYTEVRAALAAAERDGRIDRTALNDAIVDLERLTAALQSMTVERDLAWRAGVLAERHALRGYDAVHLASMVSLDAPRVVAATWDRRLALAASQNGLGVVPRPPRWEAELADGKAGPSNKLLV